jgi:hypothetical protein
MTGSVVAPAHVPVHARRATGETLNLGGSFLFWFARQCRPKPSNTKLFPVLFVYVCSEHALITVRDKSNSSSSAVQVILASPLACNVIALCFCYGPSNNNTCGPT